MNNNLKRKEYEFSVRPYTKQQLALLYFPDTDNPHTAVNHLMAWIRRCTALKAELDAMGMPKYAKYFSPREVGAIVRYLGEPG